MPLGDNLRELYFAVVDSFLGVAERVGWKRIAFAIFVALALCAFFIFLIPWPKGEKTVSLTVKLEDENGSAVSNTIVKYSVNSLPQNSAKTNSEGLLEIKVPAKSKVRFFVEKKGFQKAEFTVFVGSTDSLELFQLKKTQRFEEKRTILFEDSKGLVTGKRIVARIECENKAISPWREFDEDMDGIIEVLLPLNCGLMSVRVEDPDYRPSLASFREGETEKVLRLKEKEPVKGSLVVKIVDESGQLLREKNFLVRIESDSYSNEAYSNGHGKVEFPDLVPAFYNVLVGDPTSEFATARVLFVEVKASRANEISIEMNPKTIGSIKVVVLDKATGTRIKNATVKLKDLNDLFIEEKNTGLNASTVEFKVKNAGPFMIVAKKEGGIGEGYFAKSVVVSDINSEIQIMLEKITEENSGRTIVRVLDEDNEPVENAKVMFRFSDTEGIVELNGRENYKFTDVNGYAFFSLGRIERSVFPFAVKYPASGGSVEDSSLINPAGLNEFTVRLVIGDCTLHIKALNEDKELVPNTEIEVFNSRGQSLSGKIPMVSGEKFYSLKADERVFVVFENPAYMSFQSEEIQLWPDTSFEVIGEMRQRSLRKKPMVFFEGIYQNGKKQELLLAGKKYNAVFVVAMPHAREFDKIGFHVRTGDKANMASDPLFINSINASGIDSIILGETFDSSNGLKREILSSGRAKWASIEWINPLRESFRVSVEFVVRQTTLPKTRLSLHYRAYAVKDGKYYREPFDAVLGEKENAPSKEGLYAEANSLVFFEGSAPACEGDFCITGEWLFSEKDRLFLEKPFVTTVFSDYNYSFVLLNNSPRAYSESRVLIVNEFDGLKENILRIEKAVLRNASGQTIEVKAVNNEILLEDLGDFSQNKEIEIELIFQPVEVKDSQFKILLVADGKIALEKVVDFGVVSAEKLYLDASPELIPAFVKTPIDAMVKNSAGEPLENVLVRFTRRIPGTESHVWIQHTNSLGIASIELPASPPGTKLVVEAEKAGFSPEKIEREITTEIVKITPSLLESSLNPGIKRSETFAVEIENLSGMNIKIKEIGILGNSKGLLDLDAMNSFSMLNSEKEINALDSIELQIAKTVLSPEASDLLKASKSLEMKIVIVFEGSERNVEYSSEIPLLVNISTAGMPDNAPCIYLDGATVPEWKTITTKNRASTEFEIVNACEQASRPVNLESLLAGIEWDSSISGIVELTVTSPSGISASEVLRPGKKVKLFEEFKSSEYGTYNAVLSFTPKTGYLGKTAKFTVWFDGEAFSKDGLVQVNNDFSAAINSEISIINLDECLKLPTQAVKIGGSEESTDFLVSSKECGPVQLFVELCRGDSECSGNTEGGIGVTPKEFELSESQSEKSISVYRKEIPGLYGITVHVRTKNGQFKLVGIVDVLVEPSEGDFLSLSRYEAVVSKETNWKDSIEITNSNLSEEVQVRANYCTECKHPENPPKECHWNIVMNEMAKNKFSMQEYFGNVLTAAGSGFAACSATGNIFTMTACAAVMAGASAVFQSASYIFGPECQIEKQSFPLQDYVMRLEEATAGISLSNFSIELNNSKMEKILSEKKEVSALTIVNNSHVEDPLPEYGILTVKLPEHIHGDPLHIKPIVSMNSAEFGPFNVPDTDSSEYSQKFHLKLVTGSSFDLNDVAIPAPKEAIPCLMGSRVGYTGKNALPRIKLSWSWDDSAIAWNSCDADNPEAFYCDATQFSIALSKRIHMLDEFFAENNYYFSCPLDPAEVEIQKFIEEHGRDKSDREVENGKIGVKNINFEVKQQNATIRALVKNDSPETAYADVKITLSGPNNYSNECLVSTPVIGSKKSYTVECSFPDLNESGVSFYTASAFVESASIDEDQGVATIYFVVSNSSQQCWLKYSTKKMEGHPIIDYFINRDIPNWKEFVTANAQFPSNWPGQTREEKMQFLRKLFDFKALLERDSFNEDFLEDFAQYYSSGQFFETPDWFAGGSDELSEFFEGKRISIKEKYTESISLSSPGTYEVFIGIDFDKQWSFFENGKPDANIEVELYKLKEPSPNSIFYYIPFDGLVGVKTENGRQGYGVDFLPEGEAIKLIGGEKGIALEKIANSNALSEISTSIEQSVSKINSKMETRGTVFAVEKTGDNARFEFSPGYATPVIMKFTHVKTSRPFRVEYRLFEEAEPIKAGSALAFWTGLGQCLDFSAEPISEVFYYSPDGFSNNSYYLEWPSAFKNGTIYLSNLFFTPVNKKIILKLETPNAVFVLPDGKESSEIQLSGIKGMEWNDQSVLSHIDSIESLFSLVEDEKICVSNSGSKSLYWWNPAELDYAGGIEDFSKSLKAGEECIGSS